MSLSLRKATLKDSDLLLAWRNDPDVVAWSATGRPVTEAEHDRWIMKALSDQTWHLYIAQEPVDYGPSQPWLLVGMGRITESAPGVATLGYSIAAEHRAQGFGAALVALLCQKAYELGYLSIQAVSRHGNTASIRALLGNGFEIDQPELLQLTRRA